MHSDFKVGAMIFAGPKALQCRRWQKESVFLLLGGKYLGISMGKGILPYSILFLSPLSF